MSSLSPTTSRPGRASGNFRTLRKVYFTRPSNRKSTRRVEVVCQKLIAGWCFNIHWGCCNMVALAERSCTPCRGGVTPLTPSECASYLAEVPDWELRNEAQTIARRFRFPDYR